MALKGSPNKNRKKVVKTPVTIADIEAIRKMDHEQLYAQLEKTLGSTKKVVDETSVLSHNTVVLKEKTGIWKFVLFLSVVFLLVLI